MGKKNIAMLRVSTIAAVISISGCAGLNRQVAEMEARGTIEAGGYTWRIPTEYEGGNSVRTQGLPSRQAATEASNKLCKKHGRIAQYVTQRNILMTGSVTFDFNCVR